MTMANTKSEAEMMKYQIKNRGLMKYSFVICGLLFSGNILAAENSLENLSDQQRIQRLERMLSSDVLREQTETIQSLREEISVLRDQLEQQEYDVEGMKQRQRNLYLDMDRRINNVEAGGRNGAGSAAPVPPPNTASSPGTVPVAVAGDTNGQEAYSQAYTLLIEGQYEQSIKAFESFKQNYPNSKYADNAQYWLGEANAALRNYTEALTVFQQLIAQYPESSKIPGARLKIGYMYFELKNWATAKETLQQVMSLYPDTKVAKMANERLQRMKREGH